MWKKIFNNSRVVFERIPHPMLDIQLNYQILIFINTPY